MKLIGFFDYPRDYNRLIHGPYDPSRYYGKPDTPLSKVKLGELPSWIMRRNFTPRAIYEALTRSYWRWQMKWIQAKRCGPAFIFHHCLAITSIYYILRYKELWAEVNYKYH